MTVLTSANKAIIAGNGVATSFGFTFNAGYAQGAPSTALALSYLSVLVTDSLGNITTIAQGSGANQCQITLNPPAAGALWGLGGSVAYNPGGVPVPLGSTVTVLRTIPLTQIVALSNQGGLFPQTVEMAMDLLEFQIQQLAAQYGQAIVAAVSDPAPLPLPPAAQRANQALVFDGSGNPIAGAIPASGIISTAMQPVVGAATLALGRTAFGLGTIAVEGIGAGMQDDGSGNLRTINNVVAVAANQAIGAAAHTNFYQATGNLIFTLARANTLFPSFSFKVYALTNTITFAIDANDTVITSYGSLSSGQSFTIPKGTVATVTTNGLASGAWFIETDVRTAPNIQTFTATGAGTYVPSPGVLWARVRGVAGGGGGGGGATNGQPGNPTTFGGIINAVGGLGGSTSSQTPGSGQACTGANLLNLTGSPGNPGITTGGTVAGSGGNGGDSPMFGGAGVGSISAGGAGLANTGGGGAGGATNAGTTVGAPGGASGAFFEHILSAPFAASYALSIATGGLGGTSGGSTAAGGAGGTGRIVIEEFFGS